MSDPLLVRFWGTRGTLPVAITARQVRAKIANALRIAGSQSFESDEEALEFIERALDFAGGATFGGATSCVEVDAGEDAFFVCDMGSGLREFGQDASMRCKGGRPKKYNFFLSHLHWDHIMGFPAFLPAFDYDCEIVIHSCHPDAEEALRRQQEEISFPLEFRFWEAGIRFELMEPGVERHVDGLRVTAIRQHHPHESFGYRFSDPSGRVVVYSTDSEHKVDDMDSEESFVDFFKGADLVICDTMYSLADSNSTKEDWGHSSNLVAIDLCHRARARKLALFHHDPASDDEDIQRMHEDSIRYEELSRERDPLEVICAYDGLEVTL
ncbi:MAG TPA: MBL fold metallo-hydrolase [Sphingomicrobium sp.]|nr:MBL fold metallo-hydrolase [Sphingomicrobium sp.]